MSAALHAQVDAARCATTPDLALRAERHLGVRAAVALMVQDQPQLAHQVLTRSVERQARIAGCGRVHIDATAARS